MYPVALARISATALSNHWQAVAVPFVMFACSRDIVELIYHQQFAQVRSH